MASEYMAAKGTRKNPAGGESQRKKKMATEVNFLQKGLIKEGNGEENRGGGAEARGELREKSIEEKEIRPEKGRGKDSRGMKGEDVKEIDSDKPVCGKPPLSGIEKKRR